MSLTQGNDQKAQSWVKDISAEGSILGTYLVKQKMMGRTRKGDPFISLILADRTGNIEARVWEQAEAFSSLFSEGDVIEVQGQAVIFRGQLQLTISDLQVPKDKPDLSLFLESSPRDVSEMMTLLKDILLSIKNPSLKDLVTQFLDDPSFISSLKRVPAAKNFHHDYLGGLLEHTLSVCQMADLLAHHYSQLDKDLLITAAFLHDIGKIRELTCHPKIDYTDQGRLLGHIVLGGEMLEEKVSTLKHFPEELAVRLKHLIFSHHGHHEFGSPKRPKFLEAFALHLIDDLDAKINGLTRFMKKDHREGNWTEFNRLLGRYLLKVNPLPSEEESLSQSPGNEKQGALFPFGP